MKPFNRTKIADKLGIARSTLYYKSKKKEKDKNDKLRIEEIMNSNPSYGHRRVAIALDFNKKKALAFLKNEDYNPNI
jgi:DNA-binding XRE family transcriptional regulator